MRIVTRDRVQQVEELIRRHEAGLRGFLRYMGCPPDLLDDLVQDVFLSVLSSRFEERSDASTAAFLRRVARNLLLKTLDRLRRQPLLTDLSVAEDAAEDAWMEFERGDGGRGYVDALRHCYAFLGARASDVLELRYDQRLGGAAIAERLGMKEAGVKSILVRAKKKLRECIERRLAS